MAPLICSLETQHAVRDSEGSMIADLPFFFGTQRLKEPTFTLYASKSLLSDHFKSEERNSTLLRKKHPWEDADFSLDLQKCGPKKKLHNCHDPILSMSIDRHCTLMKRPLLLISSRKSFNTTCSKSLITDAWQPAWCGRMPRPPLIQPSTISSTLNPPTASLGCWRCLAQHAHPQSLPQCNGRTLEESFFW